MRKYTVKFFLNGGDLEEEVFALNSRDAMEAIKHKHTNSIPYRASLIWE